MVAFHELKKSRSAVMFGWFEVRVTEAEFHTVPRLGEVGTLDHGKYFVSLLQLFKKSCSKKKEKSKKTSSLFPWTPLETNKNIECTTAVLRPDH